MPKLKVFSGEEVEYVEVYDEPSHIKQFANEYAYCYKADIEPGASCMWHRHSQDSFYMSLAGVEAINKPATAAEGPLVVNKGDKWWSLYAGKEMVHQVCLPGTCKHAASFFGVEVLKTPPVTSAEPLDHPCYTLDTTNSTAKARIYDLTIAPGATTGTHTWNFYATILNMTGDATLAAEGEANPWSGGRLQEYGSNTWVEGPVEFSLTNNGQEEYRAVVVEWLKQE